jgi:hypothetical protein
MTCKDCIHYDLCDRNQELAIECTEWGDQLIDTVEMDCRYFKDKTHIIELPCIHETYFTHICKARGLINQFSIFAKIVSEDENTVTIDRFQKFGSLHIGIITISREDFERYYKEITKSEKELQVREIRKNESMI